MAAHQDSTGLQLALPSSLPGLPEKSRPAHLLQPIFDHDFLLNQPIQKHLWDDRGGFERVDRAILGAVLQNMPVPQLRSRLRPQQPEGPSASTSIIDRILALPLDQLKLLGNLFLVALTDARSWGGLKPKSGSGSHWHCRQSQPAQR